MELFIHIFSKKSERHIIPFWVLMIPSMPPSIKWKDYHLCFIQQMPVWLQNWSDYKIDKLFSYQKRVARSQCAPYHDELGLNLKLAEVSWFYSCKQFVFFYHLMSTPIMNYSYIHIISLWLPPIYKGLCISIRLTICKYTSIFQQSLLV